ncbi:MAG: hypothetical protein HYS08_04485 [Chlamydiae bacterium]|nr:hypothetical protein [Chlamydiota bacterium]
MKKSIFGVKEAQIIAWETQPAVLNLQLYQWVKAGNLIRMRRGIYAFPDQIQSQLALVQTLYPPAYISLESALSRYGLMPDVVFALTLITPRLTRRFKTPVGYFIYHHMKQDLFWGFDPDTLMAQKEKALVDYLYFNRFLLMPQTQCWEGLRWQNLKGVHFKRARAYARKTGIKKVLDLIISLETYGKN